MACRIQGGVFSRAVWGFDGSHDRLSSRIFWMCGHLCPFSSVRSWCRLGGILSLVYAFGSSTWACLSSLCRTRPLILSSSKTWWPTMVLSYRLVWTPSMPSFLHFSCNEGYVSCIFEECIHRIGLVKQIDENYLTVIKLVLPEPEPELCVSLSMFEFDDLGAGQLSFFVSFWGSFFFNWCTSNYSFVSDCRLLSLGFCLRRRVWLRILHSSRVNHSRQLFNMCPFSRISLCWSTDFKKLLHLASVWRPSQKWEGW